MSQGSRKFQQRATERTSEEHRAEARQDSKRDFASVEELIRHDTSVTNVPSSVAVRLSESAKSVTPPKPWWQRLFSRG
jgi:hypothetical protein